ncbi:MAG: hypothetical protein WC867_06215 [Candidatus Pacearchaeota archaeon]|jgi:hypothetical protein
MSNKYFSSLVILSLTVIVIVTLFSIGNVMAVRPQGAQITDLRNETAPRDAPQLHNAFAGNVTELVLFGYSTTQTWQGYYGNVSGTIQLADADDNVMYNWSLMDPDGEVFASRNDSISWNYMQCFNFTADESYAAGDLSLPGNVSQYGLNYTTLESMYNIAQDDPDGVNETFFENNNHDLFYVANHRFDSGECPSTQIYNSTGDNVDNLFEEVLMWDPETRSVIFTAILEKNDPLGFDNEHHDFEMMVLEDGHGVDIVSTTYYFYLEIE